VVQGDCAAIDPGQADRVWITGLNQLDRLGILDHPVLTGGHTDRQHQQRYSVPQSQIRHDNAPGSGSQQSGIAWMSGHDDS
jgi:hypothetical protein